MAKRLGSGSETASAQADAVAFLASGAAFKSGPPRRIDTHAAMVFLTADRAWKMKRAVRFPYLDFSTADRRKSALEAELVLNRRTAPSLYLGLHSINRVSEGKLAIDGPGEPIDWLLEMKRFPDEALLASIVANGGLDDPMAMRLADRIACFHASAAPVPTAGGADAIRAIVAGNRESMARYPRILPPAEVEALRIAALDAIHDAAALLDARAKAGRVRHCHGDLHLANIVMLGDEPTLFDCLEFDAALATIDVLYDLAFLLMDLWVGGWRRPANVVFNRYLDVSPDDEAGAALLPLFMSIRAAVRAHVHAAMAENPEDQPAQRARFYLRCALDLMEPGAARLIAIGGLSGSGKSTLARALGGSIGAPPGARILRTDVLRKQIAGVTPETPLPGASYTAAASRAVYRRLEDEAAAMLASGRSVIADGVFADRAERDAIEGVATAAGAPFDGLWLAAATETRAGRIAQRTADASDANVEIARRQATLATDQLGRWHCIDAGDGPAATATAASAMLGGSECSRP
ncbi:AAA family ATPase [Sphingomonas sp. MMS24-J13]|uniref:bifunctional aminoglycoside phosphotransferase/ATP-binding protein n=1 Tax=Sphingomonas sp. MMS24-J13 TaxID=3238686 RepID=UPI00384CBF55